MVLVLSAVSVASAAAQNPTPDCREPQVCSELALEARARGAYETFHDLAWRAVQTGTPNDPDLMYLLARAQALSGRRRDALIMLRRLAEAGQLRDAATDEDFRRVRDVPEWQGILAIANGPRAKAPEVTPAVAPAAPKPVPAAAPPRTAAAPPAVAPSPAPPAASPPPPAVAPSRPSAITPPKTSAITPPKTSAIASPRTPAVAPPAPAAAAPPAVVVPKPTPTVRSALRVEPAVVEDAARFSTGPFTPAGLAYDAVSRRFLFGDIAGRRLFVVGEGSDRSVDLVRGDSAGFDDVTAIAIDAKRGDLWVASTAADGSGAALHRLQLISGRVLRKLAAPGEGPMRFNDLAVTADGTVVILDTAAPRLLVLRPGATAVERLMPLATPQPTSLAVDDSGQLAYVAHRDGITRIDLRARRATMLTAATGITLTGFEFIRVHRDALVGSQAQPDGSKGLVRLQTKAGTVAQATLIETPLTSEEPVTLATISGGDLYYFVAVRGEGQASAAAPMNVRVRRVKLP
jgi:hypothetical protein